jgi:hypothetical protein
MTGWQIALLFSTGFSTGIAVLLALRSHQLALRALRTRNVPVKRLEQIEIEQADLSDRLDTALDALKVVTNRNRTRARRAAEDVASEPTGPQQGPNESVDAWKARVRLMLANGTLDPRRTH